MNEVKVRTRSEAARAARGARAPAAEPLEQLGVGDAGRVEEPRVDGRRGEARDRVDLVDEHLAVVARKQSTRAMPSSSIARKESSASSRARRPAAGGRAGTIRSVLALVVLRAVVVPVVCMRAISPTAEATRLTRLPSTPTSTSRPPRTPRPAPSRRAEGEVERIVELLRGRGPCDADARASFAGFTNTG